MAVLSSLCEESVLTVRSKSSLLWLTCSIFGYGSKHTLGTHLGPTPSTIQTLPPCVVFSNMQGYDKGREKFIYQARQSSLAGRDFGDGVLNARRVDSATLRRNRSASASSYLQADLGIGNLVTGVRPARRVGCCQLQLSP